ncbi:TetR/AcrR family transcriptional regulator C-terminal ligand-binding domain-containing protein [bacterium]|nr:TetR/AcrR family transcriptional regulator C-terminal ligand-binding domain-containing protein [bacterium]
MSRTDDILQDAFDRCEIDPGQNLDIRVDMLYGSMWYRLLVSHLSLNQR